MSRPGCGDRFFAGLAYAMPISVVIWALVIGGIWYAST